MKCEKCGYSAAQPQWKRISEEQPPHPGFYWVTRTDGRVQKQPYYVGAFQVDVIAWMPDIAPEPYTGEV